MILTYKEIGDKEFIENFGEFKLAMLKKAIKRQEMGFEDYLDKKWSLMD